MDVGAERGGQYHHTTGFEQAGECIERMGGFGHVLQHFAAEDGVEAGIGCRDCSDVADQIDACGIPAIALQTFIRCPPFLP